MDGVVVTQFVGRHRLTDQGNAIEAKGQGDFARFVPEALRPLLSGKTVFDIAGTATAAGGVEVERAMIESDTVRGTASGIIDPQGASDFALEFAAKDAAGVPLSFGTDESPIDMVVQSASVRAIGAGSEPNLDVTAALAKVETRSARIANLAIALHSDAFNIRTRSGPVTGNAAATAIAVDNPTLQPLAAGKVSVDLAGIAGQGHAHRHRRQPVGRRLVRDVRRQCVACRRLDRTRPQGRCRFSRAARGDPQSARRAHGDRREPGARYARKSVGRPVLHIVGRLHRGRQHRNRRRRPGRGGKRRACRHRHGGEGRDGTAAVFSSPRAGASRHRTSR